MAQGKNLDVTTVHLARLTAKDAHEIAKLLQALQYPGFFYLDCRNESTWKDVVEQSRGVYAVADAYFDQPVEEKMKDAREDQPASSDRGSDRPPFAPGLRLRLTPFSPRTPADHSVSAGTSRARRTSPLR